jgi:catechol 2,3-dioxygenase-like lactoylglutathione lyase family enzyme
VIGRLEKTVIDCPDPRALAEFYCQVLGMRINENMDGWVVIGSGPGLRQFSPTPPATRSALFSATTAQIELVPASAAASA